MNNIKNIIFDFGNVLIDIDVPKTEAAFRTLLGEDFDSSYANLQDRNFFERYEIGDMSEESFIWAFQNASKKIPLSPKQILKAWNNMLIGVPAHRLKMLEKLKEKYRLFLYSNTNESHMNWVRNHLKKDFNITDFDTKFFEGAYYSHLIGMRKPDPASFEYILQEAGLQANETLFIDDNEDNIHAAQSVGLMGLLHNPEADIETVLKEMKLLK